MAKSVALINTINLSFEKKCIKILIKSYLIAKLKNIYSKDWEEKTFSSHLVGIMNVCSLAKEYNLIITKEEELEDEEINSGIKSAKEANPIDIRLQTIWGQSRLKYTVEAKNISLSQWKKSNGATVNASQQQTEYITKGIDRFVSGHFKNEKGCMLAYVVNGNIDDNILKINDKIKNQQRLTEIITLIKPKEYNLNIHKSQHSNRLLNHIFFNFN